GMKALIVGLQDHSSLTHLDLNGNPFGNEGIQFLEEMLCRRESLIESLVISMCGITSLGAASVANIIRGTPRLRKIVSTKNEFDEDAVRQLAPAIAMNTTLQWIDFSDCAMGSEGVSVYIREGLLLNKSIKTMDFTCSNLSEDNAKAIGEMLLQGHE